MTIDLNEYRKLKADADKLRADSERAAGALEQLEKRLVDEFDCEDLEAAESLLEKLEGDETEAEEKYDGLLVAYKEKWDGKLKGEVDHYDYTDKEIKRFTGNL